MYNGAALYIQLIILHLHYILTDEDDFLYETRDT